MMNAPTIGTRISQYPRWFAAGETIAVPHRWKKNRLVKIPISRNNTSATYALTIPITREVVVKSPNSSTRAVSLACRSLTIIFARGGNILLLVIGFARVGMETAQQSAERLHQRGSRIANFRSMHLRQPPELLGAARGQLHFHLASIAAAADSLD